jgi:hypothetical protein
MLVNILTDKLQSTLSCLIFYDHHIKIKIKIQTIVTYFYYSKPFVLKCTRIALVPIKLLFIRYIHTKSCAFGLGTFD